MRKLFLSFLLIFTFSVQAADKDNVDELLEVMNVEQIVDQMWGQMMNIFQSSANQYQLSAEENELFNQHMSRLTDILRSEMTWEKMRPELKQIYKQNFTSAEIADLIAFYKTPTGQKVLTSMPVIMQESMQVGQALAQQAMPQLQAEVERFRQELTEKRTQQ